MITLYKKNVHKQVIDGFLKSPEEREIRLWLNQQGENPLNEFDLESLSKRFPELKNMKIMKGTMIDFHRIPSTVPTSESDTMPAVIFPALEIRLLDRQDAGDYYSLVFIEGIENIKQFIQGLV